MQVDFMMPGRLGAEYVAEDNTRRVPVMLHPYLNMVAKPGPDLQGFHLANVVGNPVEAESRALGMLARGGVQLDRSAGEK